MLIAAIIGSLIVLMGNIGLFFFLWRYLEGHKIALFQLYQSWFEASAKDENPQAVILVDMVIDRFLYKLKATLYGQEGVDARNKKALIADIGGDLLSKSNPWIGAIINNFPGLKRRLDKHPELYSEAINILEGVAGKKKGDNNEVKQDMFTGKELSTWG